MTLETKQASTNEWPAGRLAKPLVTLATAAASELASPYSLARQSRFSVTLLIPSAPFIEYVGTLPALVTTIDGPAWISPSCRKPPRMRDAAPTPVILVTET